MSENKVGSVMVVGAGIAGIQASLDLANSGYLVYLVEKKSAIGGVMAQLDKTFPTNDCSMCVISPKLVEAGRHLNIELLTQTEVEDVEGDVGNFTVRLHEKPRYIDISKCTACGECQKICPIDTPNSFDEGLRDRKAAYKLYPQAMPGAFAIDKKGTSPCKATCPANPSIQGMIALINKGEYEKAFHLFRQEHPFPAICGRICHHPCEDACTRGRVDEPISIRGIHRFISDWARNKNISFTPEKKMEREERIAIIGSGPAGLTCAYFLSIEGYHVTVYEKSDVIGGMLSSGIPSYRLPKDTIEWEISALENLGVAFKTNIEVGVDKTIGELRKEGYKAFFLAIGTQECRVLGFEGEDLDNVHAGLDFLRDINHGKDIKLSGHALIIGGGNVAVDVAMTALRSGAKKATMICLESDEEIPAGDEELLHCNEEGIEIITSSGPRKFNAENGRVRSIDFIKINCYRDASGKLRFDPIDGTEFRMEADHILPTIGQRSDWACLTDECACAFNEWGTMTVDPVTLQSSDPDIFAGGDSITGPKSVVEAIAAGKEAAVSINRFIQGLNLTEGRRKKLIPVEDVNIEVIKQKREEMAMIAPSDRHKNFNEVQLGFTEEQLRREVTRCLSCGICSECYQCVSACLANAVNHYMEPKKHEIKVGAIILAPGFEPFNPSKYSNYGYSKHPNIVTSIEFERMLSASGPHQGHLIRASDHKEPEKIAWLQCVGSRDINVGDHSYCSSVCCMYANKQAVIAKEHLSKNLDTAIFYMDMRTFGKDFDKYQLRAQSEYGVRCIRSRVHSVIPAKDDKLKIEYTTEEGKNIIEFFDMVVLSVGLSPDKEVMNLAKRLNIDLNSHGYAKTANLSPVLSNRKGIYVCGAFQEPKDIPSSVMEASASASEATRHLSEVRWTLTRSKELPPEINTAGEEPKVGVFVCNCGINIGGIADVPAVRDYAKSLPHVVHVEDNLFTCSQDTQEKMKQVIKEKGLNRVVVASCSPRTHEPLFQETIREAGLNKYLFEMANIRDQNTWVHMSNPKMATEKAKDLVRMAVAKAVYVEPLHQVSLKINKSALVVGAGVAGMEAALSIAHQGCPVHLVEKSSELGGIANILHATWQGEEIGPYLRHLIQSVENHPKIKLFMNTEVGKTVGSMGSFVTTLLSKNGKGEVILHHGASVIATGGKEHAPKSYLYGLHPSVITHLEMDLFFANHDSNLASSRSVAFIQCVESRVDDRPYCSKICCTHSLKSALKLKESDPSRKVYIIYRDIRSYGFREDLYKKAREKGILFIRYDLKRLPEVTEAGERKLKLQVIDHILQMPIELTLDILVLATGIDANDNKSLYEKFKVPSNSDGFLVEAHAKLRPVDFGSEGIFLAGTAHYPKPLEECISQAKAAASRAMLILSKDELLVGGVIADVNKDRCAVCLTCVRACPYGIPEINENSYAVIDPGECHGCGVCVAECPGKAITLKHFTDQQIVEKAKALFAKD